MSERTIIDIESDIILTLKNIYDPEIPVNIYELGLIYEIDVEEDLNVIITMTLTTPNCPVADSLLEDVRDQVADHIRCHARVVYADFVVVVPGTLAVVNLVPRQIHQR